MNPVVAVALNKFLEQRCAYDTQHLWLSKPFRTTHSSIRISTLLLITHVLDPLTQRAVAVFNICRGEKNHSEFVFILATVHCEFQSINHIWTGDNYCLLSSCRNIIKAP